MVIRLHTKRSTPIRLQIQKIFANEIQIKMNSKGETRVEAGSNTSTVTLRVVGGDEKGSLKSETVTVTQGIKIWS
jgi:hypothetical protein